MQGYKTVIFGALLTILGAVQGLDWVHLIPNNPQAVGWVTTGVGVITMVLRSLTSTPIGGGK